jgi:hypothetical protein
MRLAARLIVGVACLVAGCEKPPPPAALCPPLRLTAHAEPGTYAGQRELANICVKTRAREFTRSGAPPAEAARSAVTACAPEQAKALTALARLGPVWPYQRAILRDEYSHVAVLEAIQSRSIGCGLKPSQRPDRLPGPQWD